MRCHADVAPPVTTPGRPGVSSAWAELLRTPLRLRLYLCAVALAGLTLPLAVDRALPTPHGPLWLTVSAIFLASVVNVEVSRWLSGGLAHTHQPHKALSAWAFATAMLLPAAWLLVVVPVTYAHARWRGIRLTLWKWIGSGLYLVLCGVGAAVVRHWLLGVNPNLMGGDGHRGFSAMVAAGVVFLALEALLFAGSAVLNAAEDEVWLRGMLTSRSFYVTEGGVLLIGGLFAAVWAAGPWFTLFLIPIYFLVQHAVLLAPLRERAATAAELATKNSELIATNAALEAKNAELDRANQFKTDLMAMLGHEIGNPLTSVLGYAQVGTEAVDEGAFDDARSALEAVERNAEKMAAVLNDIVELVAQDRKALVSRPQAVEVVAHVVAAVHDLPEDCRPAIECPRHLRVLAQPGHLDQIIGNLLSNACKYAGGATRVTAASRNGLVEIEVIDEGPGIPEAFRSHLFERYRRDAQVAAKVQGTGIGLFISRELARANGGDLVHRPAEPTGSRFLLRLPEHVEAEQLEEDVA